ncbi:universal stress protein [Pannonibacter sp. Pt2-lr]
MFDTILVPVDPAEPKFSAPALEAAARFANDYGSKVRLVAVLAQTQGFIASYLPEDFESKAMGETRAMLEDLAKGMGLADGRVSGWCAAAASITRSSRKLASSRRVSS